MLDVIDQIRQLYEKGTRFTLCTVISTWRSSPRPVGSVLVVTQEGEMYGSVSGGCVENAVVAKAISVLESNQPEIAKFGVADEDAWEIGLSCGGAIEVLIEPFMGHVDQVLWEEMDGFISSNTEMIYLKSLDDRYQTQVRTIEEVKKNQAFSNELASHCQVAFQNGMNRVVTLENGERFYIQPFKSKPKMLLIGSAHIAVELIELANMYGFETIVIDPRDTFAKKTGYKTEPDQLLVNWPQEVLPDMNLDNDAYVVILSHDPKIDDEALKVVLRKPVRYVGALGSRKTHAKRVGRLESYGFSQEEISRINAPIGIDIGSHMAAEIAMSIMAKVIAVKNS